MESGRKFRKKIERRITDLGGANIKFEKTKNHQRVKFQVGGVKKMVVFPVTPTCYHSNNNTLADIRRCFND